MEATPLACAIPTCNEARVNGTSFCPKHGPKRGYRARAGKATNAAGVLACTACGGSSFKAKRSVGGKMAGGLLAPKTRVQCVTCGAITTRG